MATITIYSRYVTLEGGNYTTSVSNFLVAGGGHPFEHMYLVYDPDGVPASGDERIIRGGPEENGLKTDTQSAFTGNLNAIEGLYNITSKDWDLDESHVGVTIATGSEADLSDVWDMMKTVASNITAQHYDYEMLPGQNSNTVVAQVVAATSLELTATQVLNSDWQGFVLPQRMGNDVNTPGYLESFDSNPIDRADALAQHTLDEFNLMAENSAAGLVRSISPSMSYVVAGMGLAMQSELAEFVDPLVLDLNGNGVSLTSLTSSHAYFGLLGDGFANLTGWVSATDGILVQDASNDGKITDINELLGSSTQTGYEELALLDSNSDGKVNASDTAWSTLKVWIDANQNGVADENELHTLSSLGITEFNLSTTTSNTTVNGNILVETANFTMGGNTHTSGEVQLQYDQTNTVYNGTLASLDWDALALPALRGYGLMADTPIAMSEDSTLLTMGQNLATEATLDDFDAFTADFKDYLFEWAGVTGVAVGSNPYVNEQEKAFLEHLTGITFTTVNGSSIPEWLASAEALQETFTAAQSTLAVKFLVQADPNLSQVLNYDLVTDTVSFLTASATEVAAAAPTSSASATALYWAVLSTVDTTDIALRQSVLDHLGNLGADLTSPQSAYLNVAAGTTSGETISLPSYTASGVISGGDGNDTLNSAGGGLLGLTLYGGAGNDTLTGGQGNNLIIGGTGNDTLTAAAESHTTYVFNAGDGQDLVLDYAPDSSVLFTSGIEVSDVSYSRHGENLVITVGTSGDKITFSYASPSTYYQPSVAYSDDTVQSSQYVREQAALHTIGTSGTDTIIGDADVVNVVHAGDGNDTVKGGHEGDTIYGEDGGDSLLGGDGVTATDTGNDILDGGAGDDGLVGYDGNDTLTGGTGNDYLVGYGDSDTYKFSQGDGQDTINEAGSSGDTDVIVFDASVDKSTVTYVKSGNDLVIHYGTVGDTITVNSFWSNPSQYRIEEVHFSDSTVHDVSYILAQARIINGTSGDDSLSTFDTGNYTFHGLGGNDTLTGGSGNDTLDGGTGNDTMVGGTGNDIYIVDSTSDVVTEYTGEGTDTVQSSIAYTLGSYLENLTLTGSSNINGTGNSLDNILIGNSGNNTLTGSDGNDTLIGGTGNDVLSGGAGTDIVSYIYASGGVTVDLTAGTATGADGSDTLSGFQGIIGSAYADTLSGQSTADIIYGGDGADLVHGNDSTDTIYGGAGDDTLYGDAANDTIYGDDGGDTIHGGDGSDILHGGDGNDTIYGEGGQDAIYGDAGNDTIYGGDANDTLIGGSGNDTINGEASNDTITYSADIAGITVNLATGSATDGWGGTDTLSNIENVTGSAYADSLTGSSASNVITAGDGNDTVYAGSGNDTVSGGNGTDTLYGENGNDILTGGAGNDTLYGGANADTFYFDTASYGAVDTIKDFSTSQSDKIDIKDILIGFDPVNSAIADFVQLSTSSGNTILSVDRDGTGSTYSSTQIATIEGVTGLDVTTLVANGNLILH